jgi:hypothetical protein
VRFRLRLKPVYLYRILAAVGAAAAVAAGISMSGAVERDSTARVEKMREQAVSARDAQRLALARQLSFKQKEGYFEAELEADFKKFEIAPISLDVLKLPNQFFHEVSEPVLVQPGRVHSTEHASIRTSIERVNYKKSGATVSTRHIVATIRNTSTKPIAYFLRVVSAERGHCKVRGARMHNTMALLPGESAEIVVCAGRGAAKVEDLRVLEITPVGYVYLGKVPPSAVGHDPVSATSHAPQKKEPMCSMVPGTRISNLLKLGKTRWRDVVDFYARHSCERFQFFAGYTMATEPVKRLPVLENAPADAEAAE